MRNRAKQTKARINLAAAVASYALVIGMGVAIAWPYVVDFWHWLGRVF